ncbi:MAG: NADH-quinone oxidoreductase subunit NuoF [Gemmatimonadota bacterium]|nr:MAG: NADH-quinone oxidoreductase subunit NuoF [Gemmatimonadota bacterium]
MNSSEIILLQNVDRPNSESIGVYRESGGYKALVKALKEMKPGEIVEEVKKSGVRGRGGAGFPAGLKWSFVPKESEKPKYLCCNADEGEPGTFKDRVLIERDPHQLIEGIIISCYAIGIHTAYIYIRGEFVKGARILEQAIAEAHENGFLGKNILGSGFDVDLYVHRGAGAYICGEETALMESLEGKRGNPRNKPPFPAVVGLYGGPTVINNVETLSNVPHIVTKGGDWYAGIGTEKSTGTKLFCISGHVQKPGVYELPLGVPLKELIYNVAGGLGEGHRLKAVIPGGSSTPILTAEEAEKVTLDYESLEALGTALGSGAVIVMDETTCIVRSTWRLSKFYEHESCGQCTPCREGTAWMEKILARIVRGEGRPEDIDLLADICDNIFGNTLCPMGDAATGPVLSTVRKFRNEYEYFIEHKRSIVGN